MKKFVIENISDVYSSFETPPTDFTIIDFETANKSPDSVCQMGLVKVAGSRIVDKKSYLIRPPYQKFIFSDVHGITLEDVKNAPNFAELWSDIKAYIDHQTIAAYNLVFDWRCLFATLNYYQLSYPSFEAFDVLANLKHARELEFENYKLLTVAQTLGLKHQAHDALSDSVCTAQIQLYLNKNFPEQTTQIYVSSYDVMLDKIARGELSDEKINFYGNSLLNDKEVLDYKEYKKLFMMIEQIAAVHSNAALYKLCGLFYEKANRIPRAISLYKQSLALDAGMRLKTRIQRLEKIMNQK